MWESIYSSMHIYTLHIWGVSRGCTGYAVRLFMCVWGSSSRASWLRGVFFRGLDLHRR